MIFSLGEIHEAAKKVLSADPSRRIFAFYGEMGSGKTTLIKALCEALGVDDHTASPTFSLVNEYRTKKGTRVFHFDFYRLKNEAEAFDLGVEEYFCSGSYCFIEWPEKIENLLPQGSVKIQISAEGEKRTLAILD